MSFEYNWIGSLSTIVLSIIIVAIGRFVLFRIPSIKAVKDFNRAQNRYKLKTRPERYAGRLRSSNRISLATNIVFFVGILPFFVTFESQSIGKMAFDLFLILMVYDFFYYLTHRFLFHGNGYFKKVHGVHHQARTRVSSVDSLLLHPWEVFIGTALFFVVTGALGLIMGTQFHVATVTAATVIYTQINQINHCRIDGEKFPWKILSWIAQSHDAHHINMHKGNYATITLLYDFLFGTLEPIHQPEQDASTELTKGYTVDMPIDTPATASKAEPEQQAA
ncbi:MAG: sterol desaturase family protein [Pseudomonadales bacterium]|nr:sterol desaturase family protein [Pseudomonadales bacterium]